MLRFYDLKDRPDFILLRRLLLNEIRAKVSFGLSKAVLGQVLRDDIQLMLKCESHLRRLLNELEVDRLMKSMQFPMNVRVVEGGRTKVTHSYDTNLIHVDAWSGAPSDAQNVILFIDIEGEPDCVDFYEFLNPKLISEAITFRGPYDQALKRYPVRRLETPKAEAGQLIIFDQSVPHRTEKKHKEGIRVSIDVRLRPETSYVDGGKCIDRKKFLDYTPGNPGWGYYWSISPPGEKFRCFEDKAKYELKVAQRFGPNAELLRQEYIDLVMKNEKFSLRRRSDD